MGLILLWFTRKQKVARYFVTIGVILLVGLSYRPFSDALLRPLEYKYPSFQNYNDISEVKWIVVLGGGHTSDSQFPSVGQLNSASLVRLVEGLRIYNMLLDCKLLLSGGGGSNTESNAKVLADVARAIGVDERDIVLEQASKDTKDEARFVKDIVGNEKIILVTSASHMPRSMALFRGQGMDPVPAPTGHLVKEWPGEKTWISFPSSAGLKKVERAFYEYLGMAWAKLRGQI